MPKRPTNNKTKARAHNKKLSSSLEEPVDPKKLRSWKERGKRRKRTYQSRK